jgi:lipopolysaccharide biosynthesis regulator YciM
MSASILFVTVLIPIFVALGIVMGKSRAREKARRIAEYRASPESHILNLHD